MTNHIHLRVTPQSRDSISAAPQALDPATVKEIRACLQTGMPLGNDRFRGEIGRARGVKVGYASRGRPRQAKAEPIAPDGQHSLAL